MPKRSSPFPQQDLTQPVGNGIKRDVLPDTAQSEFDTRPKPGGKKETDFEKELQPLLPAKEPDLVKSPLIMTPPASVYGVVDRGDGSKAWWYVLGVGAVIGGYYYFNHRD